MILILITFLSIIIVKFNGGNDETKMNEDLAQEIEKNVWSYLFEKGHKEEEIIEFEVKYNPKIGNVSDAYYVYVVFKDDKDMTYVYEKINGKVVQTGFTGTDDLGKHTE